jgi:hypothetical protein
MTCPSRSSSHAKWCTTVDPDAANSISKQTAAFSGPDMHALCTWRAPHLHESSFANDEHILVHDGVFFADIGGELVCPRARELPFSNTPMDVSSTCLVFCHVCILMTCVFLNIGIDLETRMHDARLYRLTVLPLYALGSLKLSLSSSSTHSGRPCTL